MTASRCAAARSTRASHSSALHSSRLMRETWNCTLISLLLSRGSYGGDTEKYHVASTRSSPVHSKNSGDIRFGLSCWVGVMDGRRTAYTFESAGRGSALPVSGLV